MFNEDFCEVDDDDDDDDDEWWWRGWRWWGPMSANSTWWVLDTIPIERCD